jgi:D-sedoheptulose 7-phosphate isomerase
MSLWGEKVAYNSIIIAPSETLTSEQRVLKNEREWYMEADRELMETYLEELCQMLSRLPMQPLLEILRLLRDARQNNRRIYIFGNGGSAATASHMACDFGKNTVQPNRARFQVIALTDNMPTITAYANDEGYENIFSEPILSLGNAGDLAIAISGSGNSLNVLKGVQAARQIGMTTIGLTGFAGGKLKDLVDVCLVAPSNRIEQVEDAHMIIDHLLTLALRA